MRLAGRIDRREVALGVLRHVDDDLQQVRRPRPGRFEAPPEAGVHLVGLTLEGVAGLTHLARDLHHLGAARAARRHRLGEPGGRIDELALDGPAVGADDGDAVDLDQELLGRQGGNPQQRARRHVVEGQRLLAARPVGGQVRLGIEVDDVGGGLDEVGQRRPRRLELALDASPHRRRLRRDAVAAAHLSRHVDRLHAVRGHRHRPVEAVRRVEALDLQVGPRLRHHRDDLDLDPQRLREQLPDADHRARRPVPLGERRQPHLGDQRVLRRLEVLHEDANLHDVLGRRPRLLEPPHHPRERRLDVLAERLALPDLTGHEDGLDAVVRRGDDLREAAHGIDVLDLRRRDAGQQARDQARDEGKPCSVRHRSVLHAGCGSILRAGSDPDDTALPSLLPGRFEGGALRSVPQTWYKRTGERTWPRPR